MHSHKKEYRFLLVDDQKLMLNLLKGILKGGGYKKFAFAMTGKQALTTIKKHPVDMIVADWSMPNMNGVELLKLIRNNPLYCDIPFIMITGEASKERIIYAMEEGVDAYLIKPVTTNKAVETIEKIFDENSNSESMRNKSSNVFRLKHLKKYDEAITLAHQILNEYENSELYLVLSECYLKNLDFDNAIKYAQKVLAIKEDSRAVFLLGKIHMEEKRYGKAIEKFEKSSKMNPLNISRKIEVGKAYFKFGLVNEADETFESLGKSEISDLDCVDIGSAYLSSGNLEKAGKYLARVVDPIPEMISVFNKYAMELRKAGKHEESIKQYNVCLGIMPGNPVILFNLGYMYFLEGKFEEAKNALENSLKSKPNFKEAKQVLNNIKSKQVVSLKK